MLGRVIGLGIFAWTGLAALQADNGFDTAQTVEESVRLLGFDQPLRAEREGGTQWLRIRGMERALTPREHVAAHQTRENWNVAIRSLRVDFLRLRAAGFRTVCLLRWGNEVWSRVRINRGSGNGNRSPMDLREVYERAKSLAETYGDVVDVWEIENEPDIPFFADNADVFAAFFKTVALGLAAGRAPHERNEKGDGICVHQSGVDLAGPSAMLPGLLQNPKVRPLARGESVLAAEQWKSRVVMPAMCLPPGPYFEQLFDNGLLGYTEGFNYHYYGFAMDYTGVYRQFEDAVARVSPNHPSPPVGGFGARGKRFVSSSSRDLPVFLTEWGYSLLDGPDAQTIEGRVRQWRFFETTGRENERLRLRAPLAFLLVPYYEHGAKEFGLAMPMAERLASHFGYETRSAEQPEVDETGPTGAKLADIAAGNFFRAGGLTFTQDNFGAKSVAPWMRRIGEKTAGAEASPALAWLLDRTVKRSRTDLSRFLEPRHGSRDWAVRTESPSPVVLDFIAGAGTQAVKSYQGYWLGGEAVVGGGDSASIRRVGRGTLVVYNFSSQQAEVTLPWSEEVAPALGADGAGAAVVRLEPGERREIAVLLKTRTDAFLPSEARLVAEVRCGGVKTVSRWATRMYAVPLGYVAKDERDFSFPADTAAVNRTFLMTRPRAPEEPPLKQDGRWLVTDGMRVEETAWGWRFHVDHFPGVALRPAVAELSLPADWRMPAGTVLSYDYRMVLEPRANEALANDPDPKRRLQTGRGGAIAESYIRTANGNLFSTVPRLSPGPDWKRYNQSAETFTMFFLGRTELPWRFLENQPAALVFFVRPTHLPAVFEVRNPRQAAFGVAEKPVGAGLASREKSP